MVEDATKVAATLLQDQVTVLKSVVVSGTGPPRW